MPQKKLAFVVVPKSWFDQTLGRIGITGPSGSTGDMHIVISAIDDVADHRGLWLSDVQTLLEKEKDGSRVTFERFMVPWQFVLAVGVHDIAESVKMPTGFTGATVLGDANK
jgi:hypothetical protein